METSWNDILNALVITIGIPTGFFLLKMGLRIRKADPEKYERNRQVTLLCKKVNCGVILSEKEKTEFELYIRGKVITMDRKNNFILSDLCLDEVFNSQK